MKSHRAQSRFERAKWRIAYLAPVWVLQSILSLVILGIFSWRLAATIRDVKEEDEDGEELIIILVYEVANIIASMALGICVIVEATKYYAESLTPWTLLVSNVAKLTYAIAILVLDVVAFVQHDDERYSLVSLGIAVPLLITTVTMIIYAIVGYRRAASHGEYAHPANVKSYGFHNGPGHYRDGSHSSRSSMRQSVDRTISMERGRPRLSSGSGSSIYSTTTTTQDPSPRSSSSEPPIVTQYSHERDTRFEEYMSLHGRSMPAEPSSVAAHWESTRTVGVAGRARGASTSKSKVMVSDHLLLSVPEEDGDAAGSSSSAAATAKAPVGAKRSTDSEDVGASVPLMSSHESATTGADGGKINGR